MSAPSLSPPSSLSSGVTQTNQAIPEVDSAVASLLALPVPDGSVLASLPADVNKARSDAQQWSTTYRALVLTTLQAVVDWSATFDSYYDQLTPLATQLAAGDSSAIAPFQSILRQLQSATVTEGKTTAAVAPQLVCYEVVIDDDVSTLNGDYSTLQQMQQSNQAAAQSDQQQADHLEDELIAEEAALIAAELIPFAGPLVAAINATIQLLTGQQADLAKSEQAAQQAANEASSDAAEEGQTAAQVQSYDTFMKDISSGVSQLGNGWDVLDSNFTELLLSEDITTYSSYTPALLQAMKADWDDLAAQAQTLLPTN